MAQGTYKSGEHINLTYHSAGDVTALTPTGVVYDEGSAVHAVETTALNSSLALAGAAATSALAQADSGTNASDSALAAAQSALAAAQSALAQADSAANAAQSAAAYAATAASSAAVAAVGSPAGIS